MCTAAVWSQWLEAKPQHQCLVHMRPLPSHPCCNHCLLPLRGVQIVIVISCWHPVGGHPISAHASLGVSCFSLQVIAEVKADPPPASMSLTEQRRLAQSIRQQMGLPPDEDDEAMKVTTCPFLSHSLSSSAGHALMCPHAPPWLTCTCPVHVMSPLRQGMLCSKGKLEI